MPASVLSINGDVLRQITLVASRKTCASLMRTCRFLYHEAAIYTLGRGFDVRVVLFFFLQGEAVLLERLWKKVTGKRVGGAIGKLWTYVIVLGGGQMAGMSSADPSF